ncbi:MAG: tetratricopeptide repeat protein [Ignavibacteriota bacterium]
MAALLLLPANVLAQAYVNPEMCAACHPAIAKTYRQNGMGRSFAAPQAKIPIEDFTRNNAYYHAPSDTHYQMLRRGDRIFQRRYQVGFDGHETNVDEKEVDYIVGSGNHMRTYLHREPDGSLRQLPLAWYAEKNGYWAMNPGFDTADYPYARRRIAYDCMFCHNAYPQTPPGHDRLGDLPVYAGKLPEGIDCQRCHGPGERHVAIASTAGATREAIRDAIVNPAHLSAERQLDVCAQCHLKTTEFRLPHAIKRYQRGDFSYRPGEPLAAFSLAFDESPGPAKTDRFETASAVTRMRESRCFRESGGALRCTTCHNPHDIRHGSEGAALYNAACRKCHAQAFTQAVALGKHTAAADCIGCHMPKRRTDDIVHMVVTDHRVQRVKPAGDLLADRPEYHEDAATSYRGEVVPYYPERLADTLYLALAQVRDSANLAKGVPQLERAIAETKPVQPEALLELAAALRATGQIGPAIERLQQALRIDPAYVPAALDLNQALRDAGDPTSALAVAQHAIEIAPDDSRAWNALGQTALDLGRPADTLTALRHALALDPELPEAHNGLGIALAQTGDVTGAEAEFREAVRILPNFGEPHGNLASLLDGRQDVRQAEYEYQLAIRLGPLDVAARFNYGSMLMALRRFEDAEVQLRAGLHINPNVAEAHDLLGGVLERKGSVEQALAEYREAVRLKPEFGRAQLDLGAVLLDRGDRTSAAEHLSMAAKSDDPNLRRMADGLLQKLATKEK